MGVVIVVTFGYVFYLQNNALQWFFVCLFFLGLGGANYTSILFLAARDSTKPNVARARWPSRKMWGVSRAPAPRFLWGWECAIFKRW